MNAIEEILEDKKPEQHESLESSSSESEGDASSNSSGDSDAKKGKNNLQNKEDISDAIKLPIKSSWYEINGDGQVLPPVKPRTDDHD